MHTALCAMFANMRPKHRADRYWPRFLRALRDRAIMRSENGCKCALPPASRIRDPLLRACRMRKAQVSYLLHAYRRWLLTGLVTAEPRRAQPCPGAHRSDLHAPLPISPRSALPRCFVHVVFCAVWLLVKLSARTVGERARACTESACFAQWPTRKTSAIS